MKRVLSSFTRSTPNRRNNLGKDPLCEGRKEGNVRREGRRGGEDDSKGAGGGGGREERGND